MFCGVSFCVYFHIFCDVYIRFLASGAFSFNGRSACGRFSVELSSVYDNKILSVSWLIAKQLCVYGASAFSIGTDVALLRCWVGSSDWIGKLGLGFAGLLDWVPL